MYVCEREQILSTETPHICCKKKNQYFNDLAGDARFVFEYLLRLAWWKSEILPSEAMASLAALAAVCCSLDGGCWLLH